MSDPYPETAALARAWRSAAERDLASYAWVPTEVERRIAADVTYGTKAPAAGLPPYVKDPLWVRLQRLAVWAPVIRLAMSAGRWQLPEGTVAPPPAGAPVNLPGLLAALYGPARLVEQWQQRHLGLGNHNVSEAEADAALVEQTPGVEEHLADAETLFTGMMSVGLTLYVVTSGDVEL